MRSSHNLGALFQICNKVILSFLAFPLVHERPRHFYSVSGYSQLVVCPIRSSMGHAGRGCRCRLALAVRPLYHPEHFRVQEGEGNVLEIEVERS